MTALDSRPAIWVACAREHPTDPADGVGADSTAAVGDLLSIACMASHPVIPDLLCSRLAGHGGLHAEREKDGQRAEN